MAEGDKVGIGVGCGSQRHWSMSDVRALWPLVAHAHSVALLVSHVSGQKNVWADELSRDKLDRFRSKPLASCASQMRSLASLAC